MKTFYILSFLLLSIVSQNTIAQNPYQSQYKLQHRTAYGQMLQYDGGGTLVVSNSNTPCHSSTRNCRNYVNANRMSANGNLLWHKSYSTEYTYVSYEMKSATTSDGGFAFLEGIIDTATGSYHGGLVVRCDAKGNLQWAKQITSKKYVHFEPYVVSEDNDGNIILLYSVANDIYSSPILQILKLSGTGDLVWQKTLYMTMYAYTFYVANSFRQVRDKYIIAGEFNNQYFEGLLSSSLLVLDTKGAIVKNKQLNVKGLPSTLYNSSALWTFANDNLLYLLGTYTNNEPEIGSRYYLLPISDTTTTATATLLPYDNFALQHYLRNYKNALPFSYYYTTFEKRGGFAQFSSDAIYTYVKQYDTLGRICPGNTLPKIDTTLLSKQFSIADETGYKVINDSVYVTDKKVKVFVDSIEYDITCSSESLVADNDKAKLVTDNKTTLAAISISPNPAKNYILIGGLPVSKTIIEIIDGLGRTRISCNSIGSSQYKIDVSRLNAGIYYVQIRTTNKVETSKFIKE